MSQKRTHFPAAVTALIAMCIGCDCRDQRLAGFAEQAVQMQAKQNDEMAQLNREVGSGTRQLVEASGAATDKLLTMQGELLQQHNQLELERCSLADDRARDSILGPLISVVGFTLMSLLPLLVCWQLLSHLQHEPHEPMISNLLINELLSKEEMRQLTKRSEPAALARPISQGPVQQSADEH